MDVEDVEVLRRIPKDRHQGSDYMAELEEGRHRYKLNGHFYQFIDSFIAIS